VRLRIVPVTLRDARAYVDAHHRHLGAPQGGKFAVGVADEHRRIRGVAIAGRPVARLLDDGWTLEVTRVATDSAPNACSALYGAVRRAAKALGYARVVTYTRAGERGASLLAAGLAPVTVSRGGAWSRRSRPRGDTAGESKTRWEIVLTGRQ
jgi:hypothetical protein